MTYKKYFWILYLLFIFVFESKAIYSELIIYTDTMEIELNRYAFMFTELVALIGLFGYAFKKPLITPTFWLIFALFYSVYSIIIHYSNRLYYEQITPDGYFIITSLLTILAIFPWYIALFLYSKKSNKYWLNKPKNV